mgnify:CR=1 FL=1
MGDESAIGYALGDQGRLPPPLTHVGAKLTPEWIAEVLLHGASGTLDQVQLDWDRRVALGVVLAAAGYPLNPRKGDAITGLPADAAERMVFHAGTAKAGDEVRVSGGRVLCVTALAETVALAQQRAYEVVDGIQFAGMQCRRDIGYRAL